MGLNNHGRKNAPTAASGSHLVRLSRPEAINGAPTSGLLAAGAWSHHPSALSGTPEHQLSPRPDRIEPLIRTTLPRSAFLRPIAPIAKKERATTEAPYN